MLVGGVRAVPVVLAVVLALTGCAAPATATQGQTIRAEPASTASAADSPTPTASTTPTPARSASAPTTTEAELEARVRAVLPELPGSYTIDVRELDGARRELRIDAAAPREPASMAKVFVAFTVLREVDRGALSLDTRMENGLPLSACLRAMLEVSNNECSVGLQETAGRGTMAAVLAEEGFADTAVAYGDGAANLTTASDVSALMAALADGGLLSDGSTALLLDLLESQIWREAIPRGLPAGVRQASKPGTLATGSGYLQTDTAIVWGPHTRYVLTVMGSGGTTTEGISRISRVVYEALQGPVEEAFEYDPQQMATVAEVALRQDGADTAVLAELDAGTPVEVMSSVRDWYLVRVDGLEGWLHQSDLALRRTTG